MISGRLPARRPGPGNSPARLFLFVIWCGWVCLGYGRAGAGTAGPMAAENPTGVITLRTALRLALLQNPELAVYDLEVRATEARALQAGVRPNPFFSAEVEDFAGTGQHRGFQQSQTTVTLSQLVELGGKRAARLRTARFVTALARFDYESRRLEVFAQTSQAFIAALAAQERIPLLETDRRLAADALPAITRRIDAGAASPVERTRAEITVANFDVELSAARRDLAQARARLVALWGATEPRFAGLAGDLDRVPVLADLPTLAARLPRNPALARFDAETDGRRASLTLARATAVPDVTLSPAYRHNEGNPYAESAVFTFQVPLPVFDRNQGNIRAARVELAKVGPLRQATDTRLHAELTDAYRAALAARGEISLLETRILPAARSTYQLLDEGYGLGKFNYLEILDARRTLALSRQQLLTARAALQTAAARIDTLTGGPFATAADAGKGAVSAPVNTPPPVAVPTR